MGMYNEVYKKCPECGERAYMQISQIVMGFGGFDLDRKATLEEYSVDELKQLEEALNDPANYFACESRASDLENNEDSGCGHTFTFAELSEVYKEEKQEAISRLMKD